MSEDFITINETAERLGKSPQTIRRMIKRGELLAKRIETPQGFLYVVSSKNFSKEIHKEVPVKKPEIVKQEIQKPEVPKTTDSNIEETLKRHHHETLCMIGIIEHLQDELEKERRKPRTFWAYFFDWLTS